MDVLKLCSWCIDVFLTDAVINLTVYNSFEPQNIIIMILPGRMRGGSVGTSVGGPETQERTRESLKGPLSLAIDISF